MWTHLLIFGTAMAVCCLLTPVCALVATRFGFIDQPSARKVHLRPTPRLGGLAIYAGVIASVILLFTFEFGRQEPGMWAELWGIVGGATVLVLVGLLDDRGLLHSLTKLVVGMPLAALILALSGIRIKSLPFHFFGSEGLAEPVISLLLTTGWIIVITSAFSILDYMDGLCSGVAAVAAGFFLVCAALQGQILVGIMAAAVLGANLGFLVWNFSPARIFMGDSGPLFLGFLLAAIGIKLRFLGLSGLQSWTIPVLILAVPLFDAALVTVSRIRRGVNPLTTAGKDHSGHRLADLGLGRRGAVVLIYTVTVASGLLALLVPYLPFLQSQILFAAAVLAGIVGIVVLEHIFRLTQSH
ncbi:MAG: undecaprenyl/decaprenyl-phosphate alpha-N-acetylglucosaminyl 1-phosphate transferase [Acidobacteria bacterium]|nr:MAG: undecaprenyl/decaprenyl-phosphate alpha-N-acetylglucosaminyl 1-phosphate transferase [Acidobacteriota bacterium]